MFKRFLGLTLLLSIFSALVVLAIPAAAADCTAQISGARKGVHTANVGATDGSVDSVLWPPNHKLSTLTIKATGCDVTITDVRQTEAVNAPGSGNTSPDATNCSNSGDISSVDLRSERTGGGDSRYYFVDFNMKKNNADGTHDPDAEPEVDKAVVLVPHDQGVKRTYSVPNEATFPSADGALSCAGDAA